MQEPVLILRLPISISQSDDGKSYVFSGPNAAVMHRKFITEHNLKFIKPLSNGKFLIAKSDLDLHLSKNRDPLALSIKTLAESAVK